MAEMQAVEPALHGMLDKFLSSDSTTATQRDALRRFLEMNPEREPTDHLLPVDEAKKKS